VHRVAAHADGQVGVLLRVLRTAQKYSR
jgi:hypothetical protein